MLFALLHTMLEKNGLMQNDDITILLSTFNGEKFIKEQLSSLYSQEDVGISILVRDDGSTDRTDTILDNEQQLGKLSWYRGTNKGPAASFWELLANAPESPYYSFCDQDDVWDKDKLKTALEHLSRSKDKPALYFCQTRLVDSDLKEIKSVSITPLLTFEESLIYHFATGCTMVINDALRKELLKYTPQYMRMHDLWTYLVAQAIGADIYFDPTPHISYRQHSDNAVGLKSSLAFVWKNRIKRLAQNEHIRYRLANEVWNGYKDAMPAHNAEMTRLVADYRKGIRQWFRLLFTNKIKSSSTSINITYKTAVLFRIL